MASSRTSLTTEEALLDSLLAVRDEYDSQADKPDLPLLDGPLLQRHGCHFRAHRLKDARNKTFG